MAIFDFLRKKEEIPKEIENVTREDYFDIICPRCMVRMEKKTVGKIVIDICKTCGGSWFDKDELEKVFALMKNEEAQVKNEGKTLKTPSSVISAQAANAPEIPALPNAKIIKPKRKK